MKPLERFVAVAPSVVAFTPKGGCPLKQLRRRYNKRLTMVVAFTPKGGCPLKLNVAVGLQHCDLALVAFTPKGGCLSGKRL